MPYSSGSKTLGSGHEFFTAIVLGKTNNIIRSLGDDPVVLKKIHIDTASNKQEEPELVQPKYTQPSKNSGNVKISTISLSHDTIHINSFDEMKVLKSGYDTAKIDLRDIALVQPSDGYYVTVGVYKIEENANRQIKNMYAKGITAFKFYLPANKFYYVYIFRGDTPEEADEVKWQEQLEIPDIWTKRVYK
jgi:hypothetical protein